MNFFIFISYMITSFEPCLTLMSAPYRIDDFSIAIRNYKQGNYCIALIFFENFINNNPDDTLAPEANYYLLRIYDQQNDFVKFFSRANNYLESFKYDKKREEIFNLLLQRLINQGSFFLAFEYLKKYDYLSADTTLLNKIILTLGTQGLFIDKLLKICPENESLKILKALSLNDLNERSQIFQIIKNLKGKLYLIENYLLSGDTLSAYEEYQKVKLNEMSKETLYRWANIALIFSEKDLKNLISNLEKYPELTEKRKILSMFIDKRAPENITIQNKDDIKLVQKFFNTLHIDSTKLVIPDSINIDSILNDTANIENNLITLRRKFKTNYQLDSIYCVLLIKKQAYSEAYNIITDYLKYPETIKFARIVRALKYFEEKNDKMALNDLILCSCDNQFIKFIYAECLRHTNRNPAPIYEELINNCRDSLIRFQSLSGYINDKFHREDYSAVAKLDFQNIQNDLNLSKLYLLSLVHTGKIAKAETLYLKTLGNLDTDFYIAWVEYLIENKLWKKANILLNTLNNVPEYQNNQDLYYNASLVAFHSRDYILAETRFADFISRFKNSRYYYPALFKMGTLKYLKQEFDSAAYYYGLASNDTLLCIGALQNQLIALKKGEQWQDLINTGKKLIDIDSDSIKADCYFEIGYASLRVGMINEAIKNLKAATTLKSNIDYHYWLGEAYLGKGDFIRALYQYQKIVNNFKKDEMWYPTALFKTGLTLEMLDETEEAKKIYKQIIRERGTADVWGSEAQKRLEQLK